MHCIVVELGKKPIKPSDRTASYVLPAWFTSGIAEYVDDVSEEIRDSELDQFVHSFWGNCRRDKNKLKFSKRMKLNYFQFKYQEFKAAAAVLSVVDEYVFAGVEYSDPFNIAMGTLSRSYEDKFGCYIYDHDYGELKTLDAWVREMEPDKPYYVGAVMDYKA